MRQKRGKLRENCEGQALLLTMLAVGSTLLAVTAIAGMLLLFQIRQMGDVENSTKAVFAADAGVEWELFRFACDNYRNSSTMSCYNNLNNRAVPPGMPSLGECDPATDVSCDPGCDKERNPSCTDTHIFKLSNGSTYHTTRRSKLFHVIRSFGKSGGSVRAFEVIFH